MKLRISVLVADFACADFAAKLYIINLSNSCEVIYLP